MNAVVAMRVGASILALALALGACGVPVCAQATSDSTYTVQSGDTLYGIAREVGVSVRTLMAWNDLDDTNLQKGQTLRVRPPSDDATTEAPADSSGQRESPSSDTEPASESGPETDVDTDTATTEAERPPYGRHRADVGDTFVNLALRLGTTTDSLYALNDSTTTPLPPGRTLRLPRRFGPPTHVVESGQTLYGIAGEYGVSVRALKAENDLDANTLEPGQRLQIPGRDRSVVPPSGEWAAPDSTGRVAVYPAAFAGRLTASGTAYDAEDFVVSHPSLPFDSVVLLSTQDPENHTFARVIDRGPIEEGVLMDVSDAVVEELGLDTEKKPPVALRVVWVANGSD